MAGKRQQELEHEAWNEFKQKLAATNRLADAQAIVANGPKVDFPGRHFYSNLGYFLGGFHLPAMANVDEVSLYVELLRRIDASEKLTDGVVDRFQKEAREKFPAFFT